MGIMGLGMGAPLPPSEAVQGGLPSRTDSAQVRVFRQGVFLGGGTLVSRNWVLTAGHLIFDSYDSANFDLSQYSVRFGAVIDENDRSDNAHLRVIDQVVTHPQLADVIMIHFADPVPEGTWIPTLAAGAPDRYSVGHFYGWGDGHVLSRALGVIIDPAASENAAVGRSANPSFGLDFPGDIEPMVANLITAPGDSGGGMFTVGEVLTGVQAWKAPYQHVNESGNLYGRRFWAAYYQPVWRYQAWIQSVIHGEESSTPPPSKDELKRRRLPEDVGDDLPMTSPPQVDVCDMGETSCAEPDLHWVLAALPGSGNYRGTALAVCAQASGNACSFNGTTYAGGEIGRLPLGLSDASGMGPRQVMVWCTSSGVFAPDSPARPALRISFTNDDHAEVPVGTGWWDVTPDQVDSATGKISPDIARLAAC
jgi:hypothetical protein